MYNTFGNHIYFLSLITTYVFLVWQVYFVFCIYANTLVTGHMLYNTHVVLGWQPQIFYIWKPFVLSFLYDHLSIPCFTVIFMFWISPQVFLQFINISHLAAIFVLSHLWPLIASLFCRHFFSKVMSISFEIVHTYKILMPMNYLVDILKYLTFVSHICSFISIIPLVFHLCQSCLLFVNAY